jgi:hypothetical protein
MIPGYHSQPAPSLALLAPAVCHGILYSTVRAGKRLSERSLKCCVRRFDIVEEEKAANERFES